MSKASETYATFHSRGKHGLQTTLDANHLATKGVGCIECDVDVLE
jgi:hypothetical protein